MNKRVLIISVILGLVIPAIVIMGYAGGGLTLGKADVQVGWTDAADFFPAFSQPLSYNSSGTPPEALVMNLTFPYTLKGLVEPDLESVLEAIGPVSVEATIPSLGQEPIFHITFESLYGYWWSMGQDMAWVEVFAIVHNRNPYEFVLYGIEYNIDVNGASLAWGQTDGPYIFGPDSRSEVYTGVGVDIAVAETLFRAHVRQFLKSTLNVQISVVLGLSPEMTEQLQQDTLTVLIRDGS